MSRKKRRAAKSQNKHVCAVQVTEAGEMYVVFDGKRIAQRMNKRWETMVPGYKVVDEEPNVLAIFRNDERVH